VEIVEVATTSALDKGVACAIFAAVPKPPPRLKVQRAKVIVTDAGVKRLTECELCGKEKHIAEGQTVCDECRSHGGTVRVKRKPKLKS
jgi:hypothetical protein